MVGVEGAVKKQGEGKGALQKWGGGGGFGGGGGEKKGVVVSHK